MNHRSAMHSAVAVFPLLGIFLGQLDASRLAPWEPVKGCYIGAYVDLDKNCRGDIDQFEALVGRKHATYFRYVGYGEPFPHEWVANLKRRGAAAHIAWEPNDGLESVRDDDYLRGWAQAARFSETPIFLRYASEMNGTWQAYSGDPEIYKEKWRIVYRVMHEVAPNVAMVWCPFSMPRRTIGPYYPGDDFVDWVGVNIYSVHHHDGDRTRPGGEDPREELQYIYDLYAERKPIAICEYAATHYCGACDTWVPSFAVLRAKELYTNLALRFPRVKMVNWFSVDTIGEGLAENNYSITDDPTLLATYRELIADPYFIDCCPPQAGAGPVFVAATSQFQPSSLNPTGELPSSAHNDGTAVPVSGSEPIHSLPLPPQELRIFIPQTGRAISGKVTVTIQVGEQIRVKWVELTVDGKFCYMATTEPFRWIWDTTRYREGEHLVEVAVYDMNEAVVARDEVRVIIDNTGVRHQ
ncbi:MAG: glycosyl hydrolase [Candidatus Zipacnadales bacterium]